MQVISRAKLKLFTSLKVKKYRYQQRMFCAEGLKLVHEALTSDLQVEAVVVREDFSLPPGIDLPEERSFQASQETFAKLSSQVHPEGVLVVLHFPDTTPLSTSPPRLPALLLQDIRDPGNLGTLIRTADWFGIPSLICSTGTADVYNPKVVRAAMGSLFRTQVHYLDDFEAFLRSHADQVWAADMDGVPVTEAKLQERSMLLIGNEAQGLPPALTDLPGLQRVTIPRLGEAESLNAGVAAGILAAYWRLPH